MAAQLSNGLFRLSIRDDGRGLCSEPAGTGAELASPRVRQGQGLRNMRDRIQAAGGQLRIQSRPGHGTSIEIEIDLQRT